MTDDGGGVSREDAVNSLLRHNYFPRTSASVAELPPCLTSAHLTDELVAKTAFRPGVKRDGSNGRNGAVPWSDAVRYRTSRFDGSSRHCGVPHPGSYFHLVQVIGDSWSDIEGISTNRHSSIRPTLLPDGRTISYGSYFNELDVFELTGGDADPPAGWPSKESFIDHRSFGRPYVVLADIKNFFPSFYSHTIPWALVGRSIAKARTKGGVANSLDKALQATQAGETVGIHIGPGTSTYLTEIVMMTIDSELASRGFELFVRWVDDYVYLAKSEQDAHAFLTHLDDMLSCYRLRLNETKTRVLRAPADITGTWKRDVDARLAWLERGPKQTREYLDFLRLRASGDSTGSIVRYGLSRLFDFHPDTDEPVPHSDVQENVKLLATMALGDPSIASYASRTIANEELASTTLMLQKLTHEAIRRRRSDATAWYLDAYRRRGDTPPRGVLRKLLDANTWDTVPLAIAAASGWLSDGESTRIYERLRQMPDDFARDEHWLLAHELDLVQSPFASSCGLDALLDANFSFVKF